MAIARTIADLMIQPFHVMSPAAMPQGSIFHLRLVALSLQIMGKIARFSATAYLFPAQVQQAKDYPYCQSRELADGRR